MRKTRVYLDNCCFNRPYDDQGSIVIQIETDAKLYIQELIRYDQLELVWSFVLDYENNDNPYEEIRIRIAEWQQYAVVDCGLTDEITSQAESFMKLGLRQKDATHVACAIAGQADYFITTDKKILNKKIIGIKIIDPVNFIRDFTDAE
jgi:predicted nucleic acid-binding protein